MYGTAIEDMVPSLMLGRIQTKYEPRVDFEKQLDSRLSIETLLSNTTVGAEIKAECLREMLEASQRNWRL